jgi:mono/diheme cytochrome c family protein
MLIPAIFLASIAVAQAPRTTPADDDDDDVALIGRQTFVENCLICHGEEMAANQRLTTKQWTAEVDKMVGWGSPVPPDKKSSLLTYLTTSFSDHAAAPRPDTAAATDLIRVEVPPRPTSSRGDASRGGPLYTQHCATCHGPTAQGGDLGPNLVERSILLKDPIYHETIRKGLRRMPGFAAVLKPDAEADLLAWLRTRRTP